MALTPGAVTRSVDATGDEILVLEAPGGELAQAVALIDDAAAQTGVPSNPLAVGDAALLAALAAQAEYATNDVEEVGALTYVGKQRVDGAWLVQRIDATSGLEMRYATAGNNGAVADYAAALALRGGGLTATGEAYQVTVRGM